MRWLGAVVLMLGIAGGAVAQIVTVPVATRYHTGGGGCSNSLIFSSSCNSQYLFTRIL